MQAQSIAILKALWSRLPNGRWGVHDLKSLELRPADGHDPNYFVPEDSFELLTSTPSQNAREFYSSFGLTSFLLKQSIVPVVAWKNSDDFIRCIGTAAVISCSGYMLTAAHVVSDPVERGYGGGQVGNRIKFDDELNFGVFIPWNSAVGSKGFRFFPFEKLWYWGSWKQSPLIHEQDQFVFLTDVAICKIPSMPDGAAHQPLSMSINPFVSAEAAYSIGYGEMDDIPISNVGGELRIEKFESDLRVSCGHVLNVFPGNHHLKQVPTLGPCFDFDAKIPGKMSGAPIFGAQGAIIRGVVSRSYSGQQHAYGAMLGPVMQLSLDEPGISGRTLKSLMEAGDEGIARVFGPGL